ncbi:MAG: type II toxin-antitoxin system VapC family toxin [Pseudomonadota bacterium]
MILADTSIWIDHLRQGNPQLATLLYSSDVVMHSLVLGELACGSLASRPLRLAAFKAMPRIASVSDAQALAFIEWQQLMSLGLGFVDVHLLAAVITLPGSQLWTRDRRLSEVATKLKISFKPS